jgi:hypothetical protein
MRVTFSGWAFAAISAAAGSMLAGGTVQAAASKPVVELFTSQGCSSCPPADEVLAELAAKGEVIALSLPVDYWDYLGWKDTFAKPAFTARQRTYAGARGDRQVYTPQAVINGRMHANGADTREIANAVAATSATLSVAIKIDRTADGVTVTLPASPGISAATVAAMPVIGQRKVAIGRGENARRSVTYTNIVREIVSLGAWSGAAKTLTLPAASLEGADSIVIVVQTGTETKPGGIAGAAQLALR